jgi:hypothetical protein
MALILDGPVTPQDATTFVRQVPTPADLLLEQILPNRVTESPEVDFNVLTKTGSTARFRAADAPAHINPRDTIALNRVPLLNMSASRPVVGELDLMRLYGLTYGQSPVAAAAESIYDDLATSTLDVYRRAEQARGSVLSTGTLVINEGGLNGTIDYGVPAGNKVTAGTLWSTVATSDIITFLNTQRATYLALNGFAPGGMIMSTTVLNYMQQNVKLQSMAVQTIGPNLQGFAGLIPRNTINAILGTYDLPPITMVYDTKVSVDSSNTLVMPVNLVILTPPSNIELGRTAWGPTVTARKLAGTQGVGPGIVGFVDRGDEFPYKEQTFVDSLTLPVITNPNAMMILTVA